MAGEISLSFSIVPGRSYGITDNIPLEGKPLFRRGEIVEVHSLQRENPEFPGCIYVVRSAVDGQFYSLHKDHFSVRNVHPDSRKAPSSGSEIRKRKGIQLTELSTICAAVGLFICIVAFTLLYYTSKFPAEDMRRDFGYLFIVGVAAFSTFFGVVAIATHLFKKDRRRTPYGLLLGLVTITLSIIIVAIALSALFRPFEPTVADRNKQPILEHDKVAMIMRVEPAVVKKSGTVGVTLEVHNFAKDKSYQYSSSDGAAFTARYLSSPGLSNQPSPLGAADHADDVWNYQVSLSNKGLKESVTLRPGAIIHFTASWDTGSNPPGKYQITAYFAQEEASRIVEIVDR